MHARVPKTLRALGIGFFSIISGDSERECTHVVGLVRLVSLTLLTASPRERTLPRLLVMTKLTLCLIIAILIIFMQNRPHLWDLFCFLQGSVSNVGVQIFALQYYNLHIYFLPVIPDIPDDCFCSVFCLHVNIFQELNKTAILAWVRLFFYFSEKAVENRKEVLNSGVIPQMLHFQLIFRQVKKTTKVLTKRKENGKNKLTLGLI